MIGYLTAIESRDLSSSITPIMPRLPSVYESWRIPAFDRSAGEGLADEVEQPLTSPTVEPTAIRARPPRRVEVNASAEPDASQSEPNAPLTRAIDSRLKTDHESSSTVPQPARRNTEPPTERVVTPMPEYRHENVVVHAVSKTPADVAKTASESVPRSDRRLARGNDGTRAVSPSPLILPQIRQTVPIPASHNNVESHDRQQRESSTTQKSEPSIVVTIGRIEIRAVTSPSQSRPQPERQPLMSLDDYLKQRVRGVR